MATTHGITISGHVESTIYQRAGREWISLNGKEVGVHDYRPGTSPYGMKVIQLEETYCSIYGVPITGAYSGTDIMERISHDISVFWTKLSSLIDNAQRTAEFDIKRYWELFDITVELAHTCGAEIEKERTNSRSSLLEVESSKYETNKLKQELAECSAVVDELKKTTRSFSKAVKYFSKFHDCSKPSEESPPLLHQLCQDKSVSVTEIVKELGLDIRQRARVPTLVKKMEGDHRFAQEIFSINSVGRALGLVEDVEFEPIHVAAICGNSNVMKGLYEMDPSVAKARMRQMNLSVLELSAFGSLECFELCKSWSGLSKSSFGFEEILEKHGTVLEMAARGGNSKILRSLIPSPKSSSAGKFWINLMLCACNSASGDTGSLDWLMEFNGSDLKELDLSDHIRDLCGSIQLPCLQWLVDHGISPQPLFNLDGQEMLVRYGRVDILEWMSSLPGFKFEQTDQFKDVLLDVAENGHLECLKWIWENHPGFKRQHNLLSIVSSDKKNIAHFAAIGGSLPMMKWLHSVHGANFLDEDNQGCLPIHYACKSFEMLKWMVEEAECDLEARDDEGRQVLHHAISKNQIDVIPFIVSKLGVKSLNAPIATEKPASRNAAIGKTAGHFVRSQAMGECLLKYGADPSSISSEYGGTLAE